jgi:hypothetical protein
MPNAVPEETLRLFADDRPANLFITGKTLADLNLLANTLLNQINSSLIDSK